MYINVVVVSLDGTKRNETMIINEKDVDFMNLKWEVGISQDHVYLFVTKQKTIFRIRLYSKDNLYTGEMRQKIKGGPFELLYFLKLPEHLSFPDGDFKLSPNYEDEWLQITSNENQLKKLKDMDLNLNENQTDEVFKWADFLESLCIDRTYAEKFEEDGVKEEDLKDFSYDDFSHYVKNKENFLFNIVKKISLDNTNKISNYKYQFDEIIQQ
jgi:hypothetical protein